MRRIVAVECNGFPKQYQAAKFDGLMKSASLSPTWIACGAKLQTPILVYKMDCSNHQACNQSVRLPPVIHIKLLTIRLSEYINSKYKVSSRNHTLYLHGPDHKNLPVNKNDHQSRSCRLRTNKMFGCGGPT